jgi:predicted mannosyl-3-phosphoglycerate phosphatase (HAD superfamily)
MNKDSVKELISEFDDLPYSFLKSKERLAKRQEKLDTLIWWYEDLRCANVDDMLGQIDLFPFG